jgi:ubiquinone biosynthesis monooxygenase Coq7
MEPVILAVEGALRALFANPAASRPMPSAPVPVSGQAVDNLGLPVQDSALILTPSEKAHAAALMRINHVGEVCAQALYAGQALASKNETVRAHLRKAGAEEGDHLAWTRQRLDELGGRPSLLNPLWYAGAFGMGLVAARLGDDVSLGFVQETERQVQAHLESHLQADSSGGTVPLPQHDAASRAIVAKMRDDEAEHGQQAAAMGAAELPQAVKTLMRAAAKVMTTVAYRV